MNPQPERSRKENLLQRLSHDVLVLDGAMGTRLYERGLSFQDCFDAANLEHRDWVLEIHRSYLDAGSQGILTNTFGSNPFRLARHHREGDLARILEAGVEVAREAAGDSRYVLGSIGPLGEEIEPIGRIATEEARATFRKVAEILDPGVDAFSLETFSNVKELVEAVRGVREVSGKPILAHFTVGPGGKTLRGTEPEDAALMLEEEPGVDVLGVNCSIGPRAVLETMLRIQKVTAKPLAARPNAGLPREVEGRVFYEGSPDYFARFARRFLQAGGRVLGGCCGTTPEIVRAMVRATRAVGIQVRTLGGMEHARPSRHASRPHEPVPLAERSALGRALAEGACPVSVELLPPRTPDMTKVCEAARRIRDAGATLINVPDGPRASARISNMAACVILEREVGIETLPHFCCRDRNLLGMQSDIMGAAALGIRNLLIITGAPPYQGNYPDVTAVFDVDSIGLCHIVDNLNHGLDLGGNELGARTDFCFGAALNPTALDWERERQRFHWKSEAGIDFAITQPVFDLERFFEARSALPEEGPPILAGIWPLRSLRNAEFLASEVPGVSVPSKVLERMRAADGHGKAAEEGLRIAVETAEALAGQVAGFQLAAPFNKPESALKVLETIRAAV